MNSFLSIAGEWIVWAAVFIPLLVGLITKASASSGFKAVAMILVTGLSSLAYQIDLGGGVLTKEMAGAWLLSVIVAVSSHFGVWKPLQVSSKLAPEKGLG